MALLGWLIKQSVPPWWEVGGGRLASMLCCTGSQMGIRLPHQEVGSCYVRPGIRLLGQSGATESQAFVGASSFNYPFTIRRPTSSGQARTGWSPV